MEPDQLRALFYYGSLENNFIGAQMVDIYHDRIYQQFFPILKEGTLVIDIGANIGLVSMHLSHFFERVIALEPISSHFDALTRNLASNNITNVTPLKKAIYIKDDKLPMGGPEGNRTMRSLHMAVWDNGQARETVEAITLETLFKEQKIEHVDLLKIDVEGSETEILCSSSFKNVAPKIDTIIGETHKWSGRHPQQLLDALKSNGFTVAFMPHDDEIFVARRK